MLPYAVKIGRIPEAVYGQFQEMSDMVRLFPEFPEEDLTCHAVARVAVQLYPEFRWVDGHFDRNCQHTWLTHSDADHVIIDLYPVGGGGAIILDGGAMLVCWNNLYDNSRKPNFDRSLVDAQVEFVLANM